MRTLAALGAALALGSSAGAGVWLPPMTLSTGAVSSAGARLALSPRGDAIVVWQKAGGDVMIEARVREAGARSWGPRRRLSRAGRDALAPRVAVDARGNAIAVWFLRGPLPPPDAPAAAGEQHTVQAAFRPAGGRWNAPRTLAIRGHTPDVAVDRRGNAVVAWRMTDGRIRAALRRAGGGWEPARTLFAGSGTTGPRVVFDRAGNAVAAWADGATLRSEGFVRVAGKAAGRPWSPAQTLGRGGGLGDGPEVAFDGAGTTVVAWVGRAEGNWRTQVAERPAGGDWRGPRLVSVSGFDARTPALAVGPTGEAVLAWMHFVRAPTAGTRLHAAVRSTRDSSWSAPQELSRAGHDAYYPEAAVDGAGNAVVAWYTEAPDYAGIDAATRPAGGAWSAAAEIARGGRVPHVAGDVAGNALVVWQRSAGPSTYFLQARAHDSAGPRLAGLRLPRRGTVRRPLRFSVAPFDVWSRLAGPPVWSFGDGTGARGRIVTHAFARPGTFRVVVRQSDALGNASSASRDVTVARAG